MAEEQLIDAPEQVDQQPPQGPDYTSKVYKTLKDNIDGFDKDEATFRKMVTTDPLYRAKVYKTLQDNIQGFDKKPEVFDSSIGVVHRSAVKDAESTRINGIPLPQNQQVVKMAPANTTNIDTVHGLMKATGAKLPEEQHAEELAAAQERIKNAWDNITPLAHKKLLSEKFTKAQQQEQRASTEPGYKPGAAPVLDVAPEEVEAYKADPLTQRKLMGTQIAELHKEGKAKEANQLMSDMYVADTKDLALGKEEKINGQVQELKKGKLRYSPLSQTLVKPTDLGESITDSWEKRQKDIALFDAADNDSDEDLIKKLNHEISKQDPTEPVRVPEGVAGHIGAFVGDQGPVGAVAAGFSAIPVVGEAAGAAVYGHEMARRGYAQALVRTYGALKAQGMPDAEALAKAKEDAKRNMIIDAAQGIALGAATGKLGKAVKGVEIPPASGMFQKAVTKAYNFLKEGAPSAVTQAGIANVAQQAKNASAAAAGAPHPEGEGVLEATIGAPVFHYAFGALGRGLHEAPTLMKKVLQGMTKVPEPELKAMGDGLVQDGVLTPEQNTAALKQIEEHKALDAQVPEKVKNDEVRLDLQKKIQKREELEAELKTVNKAFHPEVKEKIKALDEKMNEIAGSDEAKQETPEPEIKLTHNEQTTSGERGPLPSTEKQTEPPTGSTEPGSPGGINRPEKIFESKNATISKEGEKQLTSGHYHDLLSDVALTNKLRKNITSADTESFLRKLEKAGKIKIEC